MLRFLLVSTFLFVFISSCYSAIDPLNSLVPSVAKIEYRNGYANMNSPVKVVVDINRVDLGDEGYELICDPTEFIITAKTQAGAFYGKQTVAQLKSAGNFKACKIIDKPKMKMRGVMLDLARCKEKNEYYYHIIDQLAKWKINTVFIHFTDQEGCAIEIKKYPQIASPNAFTQEEMKDLINFAKERHIELIPEVESWGHAGYILNHFPELKESDRDLCICNPKIYEVLGDIYSEIAELFPSKYLHIGCDEALSYGECDMCKEFVSEHGKDKLVETHLNKLADMAKAVGKTPMMWTDILLEHTDIIDNISKDMIMCYWRYTETVDPVPAELLSSKGFKVIGCPAIVWYGRMILPRTDAISSVESMTDIILNNNLLGMQTTVWLPQRYLTDTINFALAYSAELSWSGKDKSKNEFAQAFIKSYFGMDPTTELAHTFWNIHNLAMSSDEIVSRMWNSVEAMDALSTQEKTSPAMTMRERARGVINALKRSRERVTKNKTEYESLILAAQVSEYINNRAVSAYLITFEVRTAERQLNSINPKSAITNYNNAINMIDNLLEQESDIISRIENNFDRWRYSEPDRVTYCRPDNILDLMYNKDGYLKELRAKLAEDLKELESK